jgi:hypothetical protein
MNANDSYRFTNPPRPRPRRRASPLWGDDGDRPSPRTLANLAALAPGAGAAGPDDRFTLDEAVAAMLGTRVVTAARLREVRRVRRRPRGEAPRHRAISSAACAALAGWDGGSTSTAAARAVARAPAALASDGARAVGARLRSPGAAAHPRRASPSTPRRCPRRGRRGARLRTRGLAPDARSATCQRAAGPAGAVAVPGGRDLDGVTNIVTSNPRRHRAAHRAGRRRYPVDFGTSFVLAAE